MADPAIPHMKENVGYPSESRDWRGGNVAFLVVDQQAAPRRFWSCAERHQHRRAILHTAAGVGLRKEKHTMPEKEAKRIWV